MTRLQLAIDTLSLDEAERLVRSVTHLIDIVEAGTPFIKRYGMEGVRQLRQATPDLDLMADMKTVDGGAFETRLAFQAGANLTTVLGSASDATVSAVVKVANAACGQVVVDLLGAANLVERANEVMALGAHMIGIHAGSDARRRGSAGPLAELKAIQSVPSVRAVVAGGLDHDSLPAVLKYRPHIVVIGTAITGSTDPVGEAASIRKLIDDAG
jgi:3-hexulose-6-phosphate synthase